MKSLLFSTGNDEKFQIAYAACKPLGAELVQKHLDVDEIQSDDCEIIVADKARRAFELVQQPVVVSDDSWQIPGLNGFPGPYMKYMDQWLTPQNFLDLTRPLADRRIILVQLLAYQDEHQQKIFRKEYTATLLTEARGTYGRPLQKTVTMPGDEGLSIAEAYDAGTVHAERDVAEGWQALVAWYKEHTL